MTKIWRDRALVAGMVALVVWFYGWTVTSNSIYPQPLFGDEQQDYYSLLLHSFRAGHLYLDVQPDPRLLAALDPYDPSKRSGADVLHDASYFRGHYYVYFGVTPVVVLRLPWRLITGHDLPQNYSVLIFATTGFIGAVTLLASLRRRYFPESNICLLLAGISVLGLASMTHAILRRSSLWEEPIASGYCFAMLTLLCLYQSLHARRPAGWLAAAGLSLGLAVGSRPTYIVGAIAVVPVLASIWRRGARFPAVAFGSAFCAVLAGLLWYNIARFGNPLEFGLHYQLNNGDLSGQRFFSPKTMEFNAFVYYLAPAQWSRYFPFVEMIVPPAGSHYFEYVYGLLVNFPFAWLALAAPLAWVGRPASDRRALRAFVGALAVFYGAIGVLVICFALAATARYMVDFTPSLMMLACVGMLSWERTATGRMKPAIRALAGAAAAFSVFVGVMLSFQLHDLFQALNPTAYRRIGHVFDLPVSWWERLSGLRYGSLELTLRFPRALPGTLEPLIATGWEYRSDCLFVRYLGDHDVQLGFAHAGDPVIWSPVLPIDQGAAHDLDVRMGSLFPPMGHPFYDRMDRFAANRIARWLNVALDGRSAFDLGQEFFDASPGSVFLGFNPYSSTYGRHFSGQIVAARRGALAIPPKFEPGYGVVEMDLSFPGGSERSFPLVVTGQPGRGDILRVRFVRPGIARFGYDHWGVGLWESGDVPVTTGPLHRLRVALPSLMRPVGAGASTGLDSKLFLELDGRVVWTQTVPFYTIKQDEINFGTNDIGASSCEPEFTGVICQVKRL
jgi:hypothetical protein